MVRHRPIQGESNVDFLGESQGSLPQPQNSLPDAGAAMNDFWSMSGSFIYRHHVDPRVKLYSTREESFLVPLKYIDVCRTTHTNLDVKQEKRIDDYGNIDGSRDLSDYWTGFTQFTQLEEKTYRRIDVVRRKTDKTAGHIQARSFMARAMEVNGKECQAEGKQNSRMKSSICITHENCEGSISSTRRRRNSRRPSRMLVRNWKHQLLLFCLAKF